MAEPVVRTLLDPLRHNSWATARLMDVLRELTDEQLAATAPGAYGSILVTLEHIIGADIGYHRRLADLPRTWPDAEDGWATFADLEAWAAKAAENWERFLEEEFAPDRVIKGEDRDGTRWELHAGMLIAQVCDHATEHRGQVCTILTTLGIEPPVLDAWAYGEATGRFRELGRD